MNKSSRAVLASIKAIEADKIRLALDDLIHGGGRNWVQEQVVTHRDYEKEQFENMR